MTKRTSLTKPRDPVVQQPSVAPPPVPVPPAVAGPTPPVPAPMPPVAQPPVAPAPEPEMAMPPAPPPIVSEATEVLGDHPADMPDTGAYLDDAWVNKLPYLAERLGVPPGAKMKGPSFELELDDGRSFDLFLMVHRGVDFIQQAIGVSQQALGAAEQIMANQRQLQQQIVHMGGRLAEVEKKLGITPALGPVPAPPGSPPRGVIKKS